MFMAFKNLDVFQTNSAIAPQQEEKAKNIEISKTAKGHFFSNDYFQKYKEAVDKDEELKTKQYEALDSIDYYNKKYLSKDKLQ